MKISTKTIVTTGLCTAVLSVLSILTIPMPSGVPVTLQTFAVALCGCVAGCRMGIASVVVYLLLGTVGVPVFAGMTGGPSWLAGYSGGFLWGFLFLAALCGAGIRRRHPVSRILCGFAGLAVCHFSGILQFAVVAGVTLPQAFAALSMPYLVKDAVSVAGAYLVALPVRKALSAGNILAEEKRPAMGK